MTGPSIDAPAVDDARLLAKILAGAGIGTMPTSAYLGEGIHAVRVTIRPADVVLSTAELDRILELRIHPHAAPPMPDDSRETREGTEEGSA